MSPRSLHLGVFSVTASVAATQWQRMRGGYAVTILGRKMPTHARFPRSKTAVAAFRSAMTLRNQHLPRTIAAGRASLLPSDGPPVNSSSLRTAPEGLNIGWALVECVSVVLSS